MYGTLDSNKNKEDNQELIDGGKTSSTSLLIGPRLPNVINNDSSNKNSTSSSSLNNNNNINNNSSGNNDEQNLLNKRKKIYSHCHVQEQENKPSSGVDKSARWRLIAVSIICLIFMVGEVVGGVLSNSLAIATDAAHLLTDLASFMISLFAIWLSSRPASRRMSFGWYRAEVIGALMSVMMIWLITGLLVYMAIERLRTNEYEIDSQVMVITATAGLLVNIIMAVALNFDGHGHSHGFHSHGHSHGHHNHNHNHNNHNHDDGSETDFIVTDTNNLPPLPLLNGSSETFSNDPTMNKQQNGSSGSTATKTAAAAEKAAAAANKKKLEAKGRGKSNINVRAAFVHVIGDFFQSLGVLIAALVIHFEPSYAFIDPICTFLFSLIVLITTINILRDATNVLMEGIPDGINFIEVREKLQELPSVIRVHNLRIWSLSLDKIAISTHLVIDDSKTPSEALKMAIDTLKSSYNFFEVTIQVEEYIDDMRDCEHCQNEEVVINVPETDNNNGQQQLLQQSGSKGVKGKTRNDLI